MTHHSFIDIVCPPKALTTHAFNDQPASSVTPHVLAHTRTSICLDHGPLYALVQPPHVIDLTAALDVNSRVLPLSSNPVCAIPVQPQSWQLSQFTHGGSAGTYDFPVSFSDNPLQSQAASPDPTRSHTLPRKHFPVVDLSVLALSSGL
ncbi:hypothetical protein FRC12_010350 [Ceratobasidium sp. 428]|nr:hypothetical protein FRC12_010350 [Ceratobasidium sp. 428]